MTAAPPPPARPRSGKHVLLGVLGILLVALAAIIVPARACRPAPPALDDLGAVPPFALVDHTGAPFTEAAMRGHPTIVAFAFTRCDSVCPMVSMRMQTLQEQTADARGRGIKLVTITVDPAHDTPAVLADYAARFKADDSRWRMLTGDPAAVKALVEGPMMMVMENRGLTPSGAPDIVHNQHFLLVDGELRIRGLYDSTDPKALAALSRAARYLLRTQATAARPAS